LNNSCCSKPTEQLSVTDAVPNAAAIVAVLALHATADGAVREITGRVLSLVNVIVCDAVPVLPHASVTAHVLVTDTVQPFTTSG
jgi:hypothetical protein